MKEFNVDLIIFDLDGTLIDSKKDIAFSVNETFRRMGIDPIPEETIYGYVGNGVRPLIDRSLAAAGKENAISQAIEHFRAIYIDHLLDTTVMFGGVDEVLESFNKNRKKMAIASNKPYRYVEKILKGLGMDDYFESVKGGDSVEMKKPAPEMLQSIMKEVSIDDPKDAVFVGDSGVDIRTGKNANVRTIGVTYGFRSRKEVEENEPDAIIDSPIELMDILR